MKAKSEVFAKFLQFKTLVENQLDKKIKIVRTDNGKEYINKKFANLFISSGIKHQKSAPYCPQQNGLAERMNRTIMEKVRCMLYDANLGKQFWAEAVYAAVDIIIMIPHSSLKKSPDEIWFGRQSTLDNLRVFGCKALAMIPHQKRGKLDEKSFNCIYMRYAEDAKAFRLYDMNDGKIVISRDVVFLENEMHTVNDKLINNDFSRVFTDDVSESNQIEAIVDSGENNGNESRIESPLDSRNAADENLDNTLQSSYFDDALDNSQDESFLDDTRSDPTYTPEENISLDADVERPITRNMSNFNFLNYHVAFLIDNEPNSYHQAIKDENAAQWIDAMKEEYESLIKNGTWEIVERPGDQKIIDNRWVYKLKKNLDGSIDRYKARLVARGFTQEFGINYNETFSPVVHLTSVRIILAIAASRKMKLKQFDVKTAFLNGDLDEVVYMEQPTGFGDGTNRVCKLLKSLYGLKQASRCWNKKFTFFIKKFGFVACKADRCVFVSKKSNKLIILILPVDDGVIAGDVMEDVDAVIEYLRGHFEIKKMDVGCFLGLEIKQHADGSIFIHQSTYTRKVLSRFRMEDCNHIAIPCDPNQTLYGFDESGVSSYPYRELIGSLMYLAVATRPDIAYAVAMASRFLENPTIVHEKAAKRILRYLKGTINSIHSRIWT